MEQKPQKKAFFDLLNRAVRKGEKASPQKQKPQKNEEVKPK